MKLTDRLHRWKLARRSARACAIAGLASSVIFGGSAPSFAAFLYPATTLGTSYTEDRPAVAINPSGNAIVAWRDRTDTILARLRSATGAYGPVLKLSSTGGNSVFPSTGIDSTGAAVVVWENGVESGAKIQGRTVSATGALGPLQLLSVAGEESHSPRIKISDDGRSFLTWVSVNGSSYTIKARARPANGAFGTTYTVSPSGTDTFAPDLAIDSSGNAVIAWQRSDGAHDRIETRHITAAGALSVVQILSTAGEDSNYPRVAGDLNGDTLIAWQRSDGTHVRVQARTRTAAGALGPVQTLSGVTGNAYYFSLAGNRSGQVVVTWSLIGTSSSDVQTCALDVTGHTEAVQTISGAGQNASGSDVGVDGSGNAWIAFGGSIGSDRRLQVRRRSATSALDRVEVLSATGSNAYNPGVAASPGGDVLVAWPLVHGVPPDSLQITAGP